LTSTLNGGDETLKQVQGKDRVQGKDSEINSE